MKNNINNIKKNSVEEHSNELLWSVEQNFNLLTFEEQNSFLSLLLKDKNFDQIRKYIIENNRLRIAFHECAHLIVWTSIEKKSYDIISIEERETMYGTSEWNIERSFPYCKTDKNKIYICLAWFVSELSAWIEYKTAYQHATKDFEDIKRRGDDEDIYQYWYKPIGFKENGDIELIQTEKSLSKEEIQAEIIQICYKELNNIAWILKNQREKYYTIAVELFKKWSLSTSDIEKTTNHLF
jgi:hypothetical protein